MSNGSIDKPQSRYAPVILQVVGLLALLRAMPLVKFVASVVGFALKVVRKTIAGIFRLLAFATRLIPMFLVAGVAGRIYYLVNKLRQKEYA